RIEDPAAPGASERLPEGVGVAVGVGPRGTRPPAASRAVGVACGHVSGGHVMFISHVVPPGGGTAGYVLSDAIQTRPATQPPGSLTAVWVAVVACYLGRRVPSVRRQASPVTDGHGLSAITIATAVAGGRNWAVIDERSCSRERRSHPPVLRLLAPLQRPIEGRGRRLDAGATGAWAILRSVAVVGDDRAPRLPARLLALRLRRRTGQGDDAVPERGVPLPRGRRPGERARRP